MARQEFGQYLTPSNFLRGVTAAALLTAATPRGAEAQAWPVWTGPYPIELEGGRVLDVSSPDRSRDVVAELWDMADPCTLTLVTVRPGQGSVFINGPVAGNARVVGNETLLSTRVNEMRANLLKQKPELANCGPDALKIVNGPTAPRPAWFDQVKNAETAQDVIESASRPAVWTKFEASGDVNVPEIGHQEALTVAEVWDGKNVDSFRLALIAPGSKLPNEQWKGGGWYVFGGTREAIATRVAEMAKEQSDLKGKEVKAYYVGNDEAPTGLTKEASMAAAVATAQDNAPVTIERAAATLPVSLPEAKAVVNEFVSVDGKLPVDVVQVNTVAYSMTLNQGETYVVISGKIASKELNTELPQKPGRSHMLVLQGAGQQVSFTNVEAGHMWVARVPGSKVNSAWLGEKIAEADGTQTTLTFRREVAPAVAASFTVNEAEQSVWNPVYGSWVVETGNRNFDNSANVAPTGKAVEQAESVASYEVGSQSLGSKDAFTLAIAWDEKDAASTRVIVVRPGSEVTKMDLTQGKAWVMKGSDEAVYRRAKEMTEEVARENKTGVKRPINVGSTPSGAIETDGTPHYWTVK